MFLTKRSLLTSVICFVHCQKFVHGFQVEPKRNNFGILGKRSNFIKVGKDFGKLYVQLGDNFQCTDNLRRFGYILSYKQHKEYLI